MVEKMFFVVCLVYLLEWKGTWELEEGGGGGGREKEWHGGESTRLSPMWPRFDSRTRRHKWLEFLVPTLRVFIWVLRFSSLQKLSTNRC